MVEEDANRWHLLTTKDALADNLLICAWVSITLRMFKESFWLKA
jgi:hypothetical protein